MEWHPELHLQLVLLLALDDEKVSIKGKHGVEEEDINVDHCIYFTFEQTLYSGVCNSLLYIDVIVSETRCWDSVPVCRLCVCAAEPLFNRCT